MKSAFSVLRKSGAAADDQESHGAAEAGGWSMIRLRHTLRIG